MPIYSVIIIMYPHTLMSNVIEWDVQFMQEPGFFVSIIYLKQMLSVWHTQSGVAWKQHP